MIKLEHINKEYPNGTHALYNINLEINDGEFVFVTGDSGAGKSTFVKLLTRQILPTSGSIVVNEKDITKLKPRQLPKYKRTIGCVFQDFKLLNNQNIFDNVAFAERIVGKSLATIKKDVPQMLAMVGLSSKAKETPTTLSGGEKQRVAIARALINKPDIILADEPTGNLDDYNSWEIIKLLQDINKMGTTVIVVTHNMDIVRQMHKREIHLKLGKIAEGGET